MPSVLSSPIPVKSIFINQTPREPYRILNNLNYPQHVIHNMFLWLKSSKHEQLDAMSTPLNSKQNPQIKLQKDEKMSEIGTHAA